MADEKKGITVKIDANLHAEIREYLERHEGMTMAEFITLAVDDELHPKIQQKEGNSMGNMRTMAFQVPEELFQRIKDYLHRQKEFVLGLIETELDREQAERESQIDAESPAEDICEETDEEAAENGFAGECEGDNGNDEETEDEDEAEGFGMTM